jgi:fructose-1,6-bisphosphatase/inositol monophosphatase family enzyme
LCWCMCAGKPLWGTLVSLLHNGSPVLGIIDQPVLQERWLGVAGRETTLNGARISARQCEGISSAYMYSTTPHMFAPGATEQVCCRAQRHHSLPSGLPICQTLGLTHTHTYTQKHRNTQKLSLGGGLSPPLFCLPRCYLPYRCCCCCHPTCAPQAFVRVRDAVRVPMYGCDCYAYGLLAAGHTDLVVEADLKPYDYMALVPVITVSVCVFGGGGEIRFEKADCWAAAGLLLGCCWAAAVMQ